LRIVAFTGLVLLALAAPVAAGDSDGAPTHGRAGGRIAWLVPGDPDLVGDTWAELSFGGSETDRAYFLVDSRLTIEKADSDLTFDVRDLHYELELGWRRAMHRGALSVYLGQRGKQNVDADGQAFVQYAGVGFESRGFRADPGAGAPRLAWRLSGGPVFKERETDAQFAARGDARLGLGTIPGAKWPVVLDARMDGLVHAGRFLVDLSAGPRVVLPTGTGRNASLFAHYQRSRNPLGLDEDAWLLGFQYEEPHEVREPRGETPEIDGFLAFGGGEGRLAGRFLIRFASPELGRRISAVFLLDGNILTADDTGELYYRYHLGLQRPMGRGIAGVYFYHRSNHQLAEPNDTVTSINVLEAGVDTPGWDRPVGPRDRRRVVLDGSLRGGYLVDSSFGEEERWHVRGGARVAFPLGRAGVAPYLLVELEDGDVQRQRYALGVDLPSGIDLRAEYRDDDQYFGEDRTAAVVTAGYAF
jgi:hypothetical protein